MRFEKGEKKFGKSQIRTGVDSIKKNTVLTLTSMVLLGKHPVNFKSFLVLETKHNNTVPVEVFLMF